MNKLLFNAKTYINKNKQLKYIVHRYLSHFTLQKVASHSLIVNNDFESFYVNNKEIRFNLGPLEDTRGIGRVAREQLAYMKRNLSKMQTTDEITHIIHFYTSIHWCPKTLPPRSIVMIHDVIPLVLPELFPEANKKWKNDFQRIARQAYHIITISQTSKNDIISHLGIQEHKISIVNNGVTKLVPSKKNGIKLPDNFFVYLGSYDSHKNVDIVLEALTLEKCLNFHLVLIGDNIQCKTKVDSLNLTHRVHFMGKLNDEDTAFVLGNATALVFPSLYEGFGLPPLEAALLYTPSICSDRPTMSEFLDGISLFANPYDANEWAKCMDKIVHDASLRQNLSQLAYEKVSKFTWDKSGKHLTNIISQDAFSMKILVDMQCIQSGSSKGGIGRYAYNLLEAMVQNNTKHKICVLLNSDLPMDHYSKLEKIIPKNDIYYFNTAGDSRESIEENRDRVKASIVLKDKTVFTINPDMFLIMSLFEGLDESVITSVGGLFPASKTAVILYDLIPLVEKEKYLNSETNKNHYMSKIDYLKKSELLLSISQFSKEEAIELLNIDDRKIVNISSAIDSKFKPYHIPTDQKDTIYRQFGIKNKFILFTGSFDLRKNQKSLIKAYALLPQKLRDEYQLILVGNGQKETVNGVKNVVSELNLTQQDVLFLGHVKDEDLVRMYNLSSLFVFPTFREGFGLPALEAMSCGIPTIGSNTTSIPEVIGNQNALFDPYDIQSITTKIEEALTNTPFRESLIASGLKQSKKFSWDQSAKMTLKALETHFDTLQNKPVTHDDSIAEKNTKERIKLTIKALPILGWLSRWIYNLGRLNNTKHHVFMLQQEVSRLLESQKQYEILYREIENKMQNELLALQNDMQTTMKNELLALQNDMQSTMKNELLALQNDMQSTMKNELLALQNDMQTTMKNELFDMKRKLLQSQNDLGLISTWNTRCGIASYSKWLIQSFNHTVTVLAPKVHKSDKVTDDESTVNRCWNLYEDNLNDLFEEIVLLGLKKVLIQFNYGLFNLNHLNHFIKKLFDRHIHIYITLHSTTDNIRQEDKKLSIIKNALEKCSIIFVHTLQDIKNLKAIGIENNVMLLNQGIIDLVPTSKQEIKNKIFTLATYGFFLESKGLLNIIEALKIIIDKGYDIRLLMYNALYSHQASADLIQKAQTMITTYNLENNIILNTDYLSDEETILKLSQTDLIVFPYTKTGESSSAAVRMAIAAQTNIAVTPQPIFEELSEFVFKFRGDTVEDLASGIIESMQKIKKNSQEVIEIETKKERFRKANLYSILSNQIKDLLV